MRKEITLKSRKDKMAFSLDTLESLFDSLPGAEYVHGDGYPGVYADYVYHIYPEHVTLLCSNIPSSNVYGNNLRNITLVFEGEPIPIESARKRVMAHARGRILVESAKNSLSK